MMSAEELFIRRYDDLVTGLGARDDYELLKVAAVLRQLLLDEQPLVHQANTTARLRLRVRVNAAHSPDDLPVKPSVHLMGLGLDPTSFTTAGGTEDLTIDQFLRCVLMTGDDVEVTVRDVIKHAANKAGGVHYDERRSDEAEELDAIVAKLSALGVHALAITLQTIARVTITSLAPLRRALVRLPDDLILFAHYKLASGALSFSGHSQFLETNMDYLFRAGWS